MHLGNQLVATGVGVVFATAAIEYLRLDPYYAWMLIGVGLVAAGGVAMARGVGGVGTRPDRVSCENCGAPNAPGAGTCQYCEAPMEPGG